MIPEYLNVMVAGVPIVFVVLGLGFLYGKFGATGKPQLGLSVLTGFLLGFGYMLSQAFPTTYAGWFAVIVFALAMGLLPSGIYETFKEAVKHA